jgi:hypothetical protein
MFYGVAGQGEIAEAGQEWVQKDKMGDSAQHLPGTQKYDDQDGVGVGAISTDEVGFPDHGDD